MSHNRLYSAMCSYLNTVYSVSLVCCGMCDFFPDENDFVFYLCLSYDAIACIADIYVPLIKC